MATLHCTVAIPTRELFSGEIYYANIPGIDGAYGVLPGHEMLVATNKSGGVLTINLDAAGNDQKKFILYQGAAQVYNDVVTVLGRFGKDVELIDVAEIRQKADRLRLRLEGLEKKPHPDKQDEAELSTGRVKLEWYQMQLDYANGSTK
ncbi:F0F1 ATP synthase subunit epsilon [Adlercreutzia sp. ZJ242]|uniref:F0F1 ATP synthase subunit epsilon n=1 Tax=Adlercreutzia sp. ZJ242 TaxID=2709409 RepID=UPI0013EA37C6|nr:F0F1 ATP synthase subunit epsilon [Adlercreutzia sp. ZJ242]